MVNIKKKYNQLMPNGLPLYNVMLTRTYQYSLVIKGWIRNTSHILDSHLFDANELRQLAMVAPTC